MPGESMADPDAVIETAHLTKWYGRRRGIEDVTLAVAAGEIFGFLGPNGAGKTTTIRCLLGLVRPQRGQSRLFGKPFHRIDRARLGVVPGELSMFERMTGAQLLDYLAALTGRRPTERAALLGRFAPGSPGPGQLPPPPGDSGGAVPGGPDHPARPGPADGRASDRPRRPPRDRSRLGAPISRG